MQPIVAVGFSFIALFAHADEPSDKDGLQGKWRIVRAMVGNPSRDQAFAGRVFGFKGDIVQMYQDGVVQDEYAFILRPDKKPKQIDLFLRGGQTPETPHLGIYAIEGDRLTLSWSKIDGKFRPTSFDLVPGNKTRQISFVLERIKK